MKLYVGNLPYNVGDDDLRSLFEEFGEVSSANVLMDRETGRSRGFGFIEMPNDSQANEAIGKTNGMDFNGRPLRVNEARPREERGGGGGGYRGGGGGGGGRGGGW